MDIHEVPQSGWKGMVKHWRSDFLAAISVSLVALPLGLGVAAASGAPPIAGLISAIIGGIVATPFRGSHLAINGPAAGLIAVILSAIHSLNDGSGQTLNYVLAATVVAGIIQVLLGLFKLGRIAEIIPSSVIQGIMVAIGIIIFSTQIHVAMGTDPTSTNTIDLLKEVFQQLPNIHPVILGISIVGITLLVVIPKIQSRLLHYFPASLWVLVVSFAVAYFFNFSADHSINIGNRSYPIGPHQLIDIPDNLLDAIMFPDFSRIADYRFWVAVLSITLIASVQTLAMAKAVDRLDPYRRKSDLNKDLVGVGLATAVAGAVGGLPIITVIVRSTVNISNNAHTKWSNFYHGILIIVFIFLLAPVIQKIPMAALAAILVYIGFRLASPKVFKKIYAMGIEQLIFMVVTIAITLYSDLLWGILGGSLFTLLVHILLSRIPIGEFFRETFSNSTNVFLNKEGSYHLKVDGIASFLAIPKISRLTNTIPKNAEVNIDLSNTRLVGMTFMDHLVDYLKIQQDTGGKVMITGLETHVSSSTHNRALKISLTSLSTKLTPRQVRLQNLAEEKGYEFANHVDWNTSYLRNFHFFEIRPVERKTNSIKGSFADIDVSWEIADVTFSEGAAFTAETFNATVMVLKLDQNIPIFSMEKEGVFERIFDRVLAFSGYKDIDFEMYADFSKKFLIMGKDEQNIRSFFNDQIVRFFENKQVYHLESNGEAMLIFDKVKLARTDETIAFIDYGEALAKLLHGKRLDLATQDVPNTNART
ncbi:MAG: SulP family inorganic anion transporter [Saprospiraceae bacterium]|nr:SulP family inorganic anion transporter [Saprospiraceae bacterium]